MTDRSKSPPATSEPGPRRRRTATAACLACAGLLVISACAQQEISRKEKGYRVPTAGKSTRSSDLFNSDRSIVKPQSE